MTSATDSDGELPFAMLFAQPVSSRRLNINEFDFEAARAKFLVAAEHSDKEDAILIVTTIRDRHADAVTAELMSRRRLVRRLNLDGFPATPEFAVAHGQSSDNIRVSLPAGEITAAQVKSVWMRRPILRALGPVAPMDDEAEQGIRIAYDALFGLLSCFSHARWVNSLTSLWRAESKIAQLRAAQDAGFTIPKTLITSDPEEARNFYGELHGKMVAKAFRGQVGSPQTRFYLIYTSRVGLAEASLFERIRHAPVILQEEVEREAEIRVTVIGKKVFSAEIRMEPGALDWRSDAHEQTYSICTLPAEIEAACLDLFRYWHLASGAIDLIRRPDGGYTFLELNSHAEWLWIEQATGLPMVSAMADLLAE